MVEIRPESINYEANQKEEYYNLAKIISEKRNEETEKAKILPISIFEIEEDTIAEVAASLNFTTPPKPAASIIITVFNNIKLTIECLLSIKKNTADVLYEIIIIDDSSSDKTMEVLSRIKSITYIRNEENQGYLQACNFGAQKAQGQYLIFLNNDTQVINGWLTALLNTFKEYTDVGAAGPKFLYPNGTLQEPGKKINKICHSSSSYH